MTGLVPAGSTWRRLGAQARFTRVRVIDPISQEGVQFEAKGDSFGFDVTVGWLPRETFLERYEPDERGWDTDTCEMLTKWSTEHGPDAECAQPTIGVTGDGVPVCAECARLHEAEGLTVKRHEEAST